MRGCTRWLFVVGLLCTVVGTAAANDYFPQSVASGDPTADSVVLWTRVVSATEEEPKLLLLEVATDESFENVVTTREIGASALDDYCATV